MDWRRTRVIDVTPANKDGSAVQPQVTVFGRERRQGFKRETAGLAIDWMSSKIQIGF